ncbi:alpha/beta hydrolase [Roseateles sp.]|uniref:alpha/beta hydrolase n=1 Tax=Roseateles sp. TaxID=1971397 RepID=UPI0039351C40
MAFHLLTPRMAGILERMQRANRPAYHQLTLEQARLAYRMGAEILDLPRAPVARVEDFQIPTPAAALPARLYAPSHDALPLLLYLHGGGFTIGGIETHDSLCRQLALRAGIAVVSLDYRLAPEHPFPAAVDDSWAALAWLREHAESLGLNGRRLAIGGDSAGGTLSAVAALHARDQGWPLALQLLITPGTLAHTNTASHKLFANGFLIDAATIEWFFNHYLPQGQRHDWRFAPMDAEDHEGLAPAFVLLAECDPLVDDGLAYADKLRAAGNAVELELVRGVTHDFIKLGRALPEAITALDACAVALRRHLLA